MGATLEGGREVGGRKNCYEREHIDFRKWHLNITALDSKPTLRIYQRHPHPRLQIPMKSQAIKSCLSVKSLCSVPPPFTLIRSDFFESVTR